MEFVWTLIAAISIVYSTLGLRMALGDWRVLRKYNIRNGRRRVARDTIALQAILVAKAGLWFAVGLVAISAPGDASISFASLSLVVASGLSALMAAILYYGARYLLRSSAANLVKEIQ